jgi:hypothetical protein
LFAVLNMKLCYSYTRIEEDLASGIRRRADVDWPACFKLAEVPGAGHTEDRGGVMLDLWHVAVGASLNADTFWTFDADQQALASASRRFRKVPVLKTPPASPSTRLRG